MFSRIKRRLSRRKTPETGPEYELQRLADKAETVDEKRFYEYVLDTFDFRGFAEVTRAHIDISPEAANKSWADLPKYLAIAYRHATIMGLDRIPPSQILDIASGPCYFGYVCRYFGHSAVGIDKAKQRIYQDIAAFLGVPLLTEPVLPRKPLPQAPRADIATALRASFHTQKRYVFDLDDWTFLFTDLVQNRMKPGGGIYFTMNENPKRKGLKISDPAFTEFIEKSGGVVDGKTIIFDDVSKTPFAAPPSRDQQPG